MRAATDIFVTHLAPQGAILYIFYNTKAVASTRRIESHHNSVRERSGSTQGLGIPHNLQSRPPLQLESCAMPQVRRATLRIVLADTGNGVRPITAVHSKR